MEADDWAAADKIHELECRVEELEIENGGLEEDLLCVIEKFCDLAEREAMRDEMAIRRSIDG